MTITDRQSDALHDSLQRALENVAAHAAITDSEAVFPRNSIDALRKEKLLGLLVPRSYGGLEGDSLHFMEIVQQIGAACASTGMIFVMHSTAISTIAKHHIGLNEILEAAASGEHLSTLACSERGTGANFYASFSKSDKSGDSFILNGDKCFVTSGGHADSYVVSTQAVGATDSVDTSIYVVPAELSENGSLAFHGSWQGLGLRGNSSIAMRLENCKLPAGNILGESGMGMQIEIGSILPCFLLGSASVYNGIAQAAFHAAVSHMGGRVHAHTGESISMLPVARNKLARMKVSLDASVALCREAARKLDSGSDDSLLSLLGAKQRACSAAVEVSSWAMDLCGGIGYSKALTVERHLRDARAGLVMAPTDDIALDLIGRAALGLPLL